MRVKIPITVLGPDGRPLAGATFAVRSRVDGSARTVFAAEVGGAVLAGGALVSDAQGRVPGYTDRGRLEATITPPAGVPLAPWIESWDAAPAGDNDIDALWLPDNVVAQRHLGDDVVGAAELADRAVAPAHLALSALDLWGQTIPQEGAVTGGTVTRLTAASVRVAAGEAWIDGDGIGGLAGRYRVTWPQTDLAAIPVAGAAGQFRLDQITLPIPAGGHGASAPVRRQGAASAAPTIANRTGAAADAGGELLLWDLLADSTGIPVFAAANNRDRRRWARGVFYSESNVAGTLTNAGSQDLSAGKRAEFGGGPVMFWWSAQVRGDSPPTYQISIATMLDGVQLVADAWEIGAAGERGRIAGSETVAAGAVPAGSHLIVPRFGSVGANGNTIWRQGSVPFKWGFRELPGVVVAP